MRPWLNPSKAFADSARKTDPFVKGFPQNVREAFDITDVNAEGIFKIENRPGEALYDRVYVFSDINYKKKDKSEKNSILLELITFFSFMTVDYKITIASEYRNMYEFISKIFSNKNAGEYQNISEGIRQLITQKIRDGNMYDVEKVMYLTVTCRANRYEEARNYFKLMDTQLEDLFTKLGSLLLPLDGYQRLASIRRLIYMDEDTEPVEFFSGKDTLLDVLPHSMDTDKNFMVLNEKLYVSVLFARKYGSSINEETAIHTLTDVSYPSLLTLDYAPVEKEVLDAKLQSTNANNERAISQEVDAKTQKNQIATGISYDKTKKREELEGYLNQIDNNDESCLLMGMLILITAPTEDILADRVDEMISKGRREKIYLETMNYVQRHAFNTVLPTGCRRVAYMRSFLTSSLVGLQPFYAVDLVEPGGQFFGLNQTTKHLAFGNRKKLTSPHGLIVGPTGAGKSFFIKMTEIVQPLLETDDDIMMIDPQNEMEYVCSYFGGQFIDFTPRCPMHLNPMEISEEVWEGNAKDHEMFVASQSEWACSLIESMMSNITFTQEHRSDIDRVVRQIYEEIFAQKKLKKQPSIVDIRARIQDKLQKAEYEQDKQRLLSIYNSMEEFTEGSYDMFAHDTNVEINNRFVVFGLKNIKKDLWETIMTTIMHYLSMRMEYNKTLQRATRFIVDEGQVVADHQGSAKILLNAFITFRKFGGINTLAVQNLVRVLEHSDLRDMLQNSGMKVFFDQGGVEADKLAEIQKLSKVEYQSLANKGKGNAVMVWNNNVILLDCKMNRDNVLYEPFNTDFHEKSEQSRKNEETDQSDQLDQAVGEIFEPAVGIRERDKAKIRSLVEIVAVSSADVAGALDITAKEARELLLEMCHEGILLQESSAGVEYFRLKEEDA